MKDQYVGDINDFLKYSLLRAFVREARASLVVAWMLTSPDTRTDGARTSYLRKPTDHRAIDPELFDALSRLVSSGERSTRAVEEADILLGARTHRALVPTTRHERELWFEELLTQCRGDDLVFVDPDNGLEVPSVPRGRRDSDKYLQYQELAALLDRGCSVCVYQHFPRVPREPYLDALLARLRALAPEGDAFAVFASSVAFLVVGRGSRLAPLRLAATMVASLWGSRLSIQNGRQSP